MPDISTINTVAVADIDKFQSITFADGQKVNNQSVSLISEAHVLIEEQVEFTNESTVTFDELEQGTYNALLFQFINIHSDNNSVYFRFASTAASDYNIQTFWNIAQGEDGSGDFSAYEAGDDVELDDNQEEANISRNLGNVSDENTSGHLWLYDLDSTFLWKSWWSSMGAKASNDAQYGFETGGNISYGNAGARAITGIEFTMSAGTFDGTIKLFGLAEAS